jgi:hypothetical protein
MQQSSANNKPGRLGSKALSPSLQVTFDTAIYQMITIRNENVNVNRKMFKLKETEADTNTTTTPQIDISTANVPTPHARPLPSRHMPQLLAYAKQLEEHH